MKKICILFMLVFMSCFSTAYAEYVFYEDFESSSVWRDLAPTTHFRRNAVDIGYDSNTLNHYGYSKLDMSKSLAGPYSEIDVPKYEGDVVTLECSVMISNDNGKSDNYIFIYDEMRNYAAPILIRNNVLYTNAYGTGAERKLMDIEDGKFYHVAAVMDMKAHTYDVYVDNVKMATNCGMGIFKGSYIQCIRVQIQGVKSGCSDVLFGYDNFIIHSGSAPLTAQERAGVFKYDSADASLRDRVKNVQFFYANAPRAYINGEMAELPKPCYYENKELYIPLRFTAEKLGGTVSYNSATGEITASKGSVIKTSSDGSIINNEGTAYITSKALSQLLSTNCQLDRVGFAVIGEEKYFYDWSSELRIIFKTICQLTLKRPDGYEIIADVAKNAPNNEHPRIFATKEEFDIIREVYNENEKPFTSWWKYVMDIADKELSEPCLNFKMDDADHASANIQGVQYRLARWGLAHWVTGDMKYAERGKQELLNMCNPKTWPDFNYYNALDIGEASYAVAIGYDLFYHVMTEEERTSVRDAMKRNIFPYYLEDVYGISYSKGLGKRNDEDPLDRGYDWVRGIFPRHNWTTIVDGGVTMAALAICDEEDSKDITREVLGASVRDVEEVFQGFLPDGAWHEGATYWSYMMNYFTGMAIALENSCGTTYGICDLPALNITGEYLYGVHGPGGAFNFSDSNPGSFSGSKTIFWYAKKYNNEGLFDSAIRFINSRGNVHSAEQLRDYALAKYHFDNYEGKVNDLPLDNHFRKIETALLRDSWDDTSANFIAIHGGRNDDPHAQMDSGTFILDALGQRFFLDLGRDDYNVSGGADKYHNNTIGHNLICFNPTTVQERGGQTLKAGANVTRFETNKVDAFAVMDLADVWGGYVSKYQRAIRLTNEKGLFILQDEFKLRPNVNEMWWFAHTGANDIVLSDDKRSATLTIGNIKLDVHILTDQKGEFQIMNPVGLPGSRTAALTNQTKIRGVKRLSFKFEEIESGTFAVAFIPYRAGFPVNQEIPEVTPIDQWTLNDDSYFDETNITTVEQIYVGGEAIQDFMPDLTTYTVEVPFGTREYPEITVNEKDAYVVQDIAADDTFYVVAGSGASENIYTVRFTRSVETKPIDGMTELPLAEMTVSAEPQPQNNKGNMSDNDFSTRWSSTGPCSATFDLGEVKKVDVIGLSWYLGKTRIADFEVHISDDGVNWKRILSANSTGESEEFEYYDIGGTNTRYVRVTGYKTSESQWISITEFKLFAIE